MSSPLRLAGLSAAVGGLLMLGWTAIKASFDLAEGDGIAWSLAWACIAIGGIVALASGNDALPLFPIGGVLGTMTGVVAAVAVAGTLPSWWRWVLLANAVAYALSGGGDNLVQEFTWLGTWVFSVWRCGPRRAGRRRSRFRRATGSVSERRGGFRFGLVGLVDSNAVTTLMFGVAFGLCGALLGWQRHRNPVAWLFAAGGVGYALSGWATCCPFPESWAAGPPWSSRWSPRPRCSAGHWRSVWRFHSPSWCSERAVADFAVACGRRASVRDRNAVRGIDGRCAGQRRLRRPPGAALVDDSRLRPTRSTVDDRDGRQRGQCSRRAGEPRRPVPARRRGRQTAAAVAAMRSRSSSCGVSVRSSAKSTIWSVISAAATPNGAIAASGDS